MGFDYSKLLGRFREKGLTQETLAEQIGISPGSMSAKLNNKTFFKQREIIDICVALDIMFSDIGVYFFTQKVR
jgi:transcriptional regulator with XRE-family HTH domain